MKICSSRIVMRPVSVGDADALLQIFHDPAVRRYLLDGKLVEIDWVRDEITASTQRFASTGVGLWGIQLAPDASLVGFVGFRDFFDPPRPQLLYGLLPDYWGRGLATEAAERVCEHAFESGFECIEASTDKPNVGSSAVLERLGMSIKGSSTDENSGIVTYEISRKHWFHNRPQRKGR